MALRETLRQSLLVRRISKKVRRLDPPRKEWFDDHYPEWRRKRIAAIEEHYGAGFFSGKTLLEVGCGYGDIGARFAELGAHVTCSDGRPGHVEEAGRRYPGVATLVADLDEPWQFDHVDVLLHMGVLYHVADIKKCMREALAAAEHVILETEVIDSSDPNAEADILEVGYDQALNNHGVRPSGAMVERLIAEAGREFTRIDDDRCNDGMHVYDWPVTDTGKHTPGLRRMWFIR